MNWNQQKQQQQQTPSCSTQIPSKNTPQQSGIPATPWPMPAYPPTLLPPPNWNKNVNNRVPTSMPPACPINYPIMPVPPPFLPPPISRYPFPPVPPIPHPIQTPSSSYSSPSSSNQYHQFNWNAQTTPRYPPMRHQASSSSSSSSSMPAQNRQHSRTRNDRDVSDSRTQSSSSRHTSSRSDYNKKSRHENDYDGDSKSNRRESKNEYSSESRGQNFSHSQSKRSESNRGSTRREQSKSRYCPYSRSGSGSSRNENVNSRETTSEKQQHDKVRKSEAGTGSNRDVDADAVKKEISKMNIAKREAEIESIFTKEANWWRCSPAELYYEPDKDNPLIFVGTQRLCELKNKFRYELVERGERVKANKTPFTFPPRRVKLRPPKPHVHHSHKSDDSSCSEDEEASNSGDESEDGAFEELQRKKTHPWRLHDELWYNDEGEMNDGPLCRCSSKARKTGIRHSIYPGEDNIKACNPNSNNQDRLYYYKISITPHTNFLLKFPTIIKHDNHEFVFEGFSFLSHVPLTNLPSCKVIRFNIEYVIAFVEEKFPNNFTVEELDMFSTFIFKELLELVDLNWKAHGDDEGCPRFHLFPRFARLLDDDGKELLSMNVILQYLLNYSKPVIDAEKLSEYRQMKDEEWMDYAKQLKGMIVTYPGMKPCSMRVDQIDRENDEKVDKHKSVQHVKKEETKEGDDSIGVIGCNGEPDDQAKDNPVLVHFGIRPPQLSYAGNPKYQKAWRDYVKFRHLLANKPKVSFTDRQTLMQKEEKLQEMRMKSDLKRDVTIVINSDGFYCTGIQCDIVQHALLIPVIICHVRFHQSLQYLENIIGYTFQDRYLLQLALTHPSYRENFGTNPDHIRNALTNCGIRQPQYGDRRVHFMNTRKRGINMLINIMSRFGCNEETTSNINHNERLEFLGDAVVEFLSSIHLFFMFPDLEEGGLATYRAAIVQNQHLAVLAKKLSLDKYMLYAHGSDLCHDLELRHAMANCFEALMGALFLDGGIDVADKVFSNTLHCDEPNLLDVWINYPPHPIQQQEPDGDRHYIDCIPRLKELTKFEDVTGIEFTHIRLLARAFTHRSVGFNNLTLGSNQRMEFLGDTVLQLVASEYLYKFFPEHHEGHLSLLRSSLVNNKTQAVVCDDLGMTQIAIYNYAKGELKTKDRADLLEAFLGALYVDKGLKFCRVFCEVCFFPRLEDFIMNQDWNDPKSKLQQCCLTLRSVDGGEPDIPIYKVIECKGPTNTRVYIVAVYFRDQRLATGEGHSIQEAEMSAAANALESSKELFPQLNHQRKVIEKSVKIVKGSKDRRKHDRRYDDNNYSP